MSNDKWTIKDKLEIMEAICTIIVTAMALWGSICAANHDLFRKVTHLIEHYHNEVIRQEKDQTNLS